MKRTPKQLLKIAKTLVKEMHEGDFNLTYRDIIEIKHLIPSTPMGVRYWVEKHKPKVCAICRALNDNE